MKRPPLCTGFYFFTFTLVWFAARRGILGYEIPGVFIIDWYTVQVRTFGGTGSGAGVWYKPKKPNLHVIVAHVLFVQKYVRLHSPPKSCFSERGILIRHFTLLPAWILVSGDPGFGPPRVNSRVRTRYLGYLRLLMANSILPQLQFVHTNNNYKYIPGYIYVHTYILRAYCAFAPVACGVRVDYTQISVLRNQDPASCTVS